MSVSENKIRRTFVQHQDIETFLKKTKGIKAAKKQILPTKISKIYLEKICKVKISILDAKYVILSAF